MNAFIMLHEYWIHRKGYPLWSTVVTVVNIKGTELFWDHRIKKGPPPTSILYPSTSLSLCVPCGHGFTVWSPPLDSAALREVHGLRQRRRPAGHQGAAGRSVDEQRQHCGLLQRLRLGHRGVPAGQGPCEFGDGQSGGRAAWPNGGNDRRREGGGSTTPGVSLQQTLTVRIIIIIIVTIIIIVVVIIVIVLAALYLCTIISRVTKVIGPSNIIKYV